MVCLYVSVCVCFDLFVCVYNRDPASVLKALCEKFIAGKMSVDDLNGILEANYVIWKKALVCYFIYTGLILFLKSFAL